MRRIFSTIAICLLIAVAAPSVAQQTPGSTATVTLPATPPVVSAPSPTPAPNTFVTVKDGETTVSGGTLAGNLLMWIALVFGAPLAGWLSTEIVKVLRRFGVDADRARLQEIIENGIALGAQKGQVDLKGKLNFEVKDKVTAFALQYAQDHGAETIKKLGFDTNDQKAIEALQARIAKALDDRAAINGAVPVTEVRPVGGPV